MSNSDKAFGLDLVLGWENDGYSLLDWKMKLLKRSPSARSRCCHSTDFPWSPSAHPSQNERPRSIGPRPLISSSRSFFTYTALHWNNCLRILTPPATGGIPTSLCAAVFEAPSDLPPSILPCRRTLLQLETRFVLLAIFHRLACPFSFSYKSLIYSC